MTIINVVLLYYFKWNAVTYSIYGLLHLFYFIAQIITIILFTYFLVDDNFYGKIKLPSKWIIASTVIILYTLFYFYSTIISVSFITVTIIIISLRYYVLKIKDSNTYLYKLPDFWFVTGHFIYTSVCYFIELFYDESIYNKLNENVYIIVFEIFISFFSSFCLIMGLNKSKQSNSTSFNKQQYDTNQLFTPDLN
jgi:hypothetical protein